MGPAALAGLRLLQAQEAAAEVDAVPGQPTGLLVRLEPDDLALELPLQPDARYPIEHLPLLDGEREQWRRTASGRLTPR
jgi:hypothetical protein